MTTNKISCVRECADAEMINKYRHEIDDNNSSIQNKASFYQILGNHTRLKILWIIQNEKSVCVCDLSDILDISISAISQQLKKMKDAGILTNKKERQTIYYSVHPDYQTEMEAILNFNTVEI